jgi:predicted amidohydrolase
VRERALGTRGSVDSNPTGGLANQPGSDRGASAQLVQIQDLLCYEPRMTESGSLVTAAIQMCSTDDVAANLDVVRRLVEAAAGEGARLVVLPECFAFLGKGERDKLAIAERLDEAAPGPIVTALAELATRHAVTIVGGGMPEREDGPDGAVRRAYNTAVVIDPRGQLVARYRKIHLFDVDIPGRATMRESDATAPGTAPCVVEVDGWKVGVTICYDVRFPELYRRLVMDGGAEVLLVPAAFTAHTGRAHWHLLLRARAVENQAWTVAAAQWGRHNEKRESFGHALVIDPWGGVVGERPDGDGVVLHALDRATLDKTRREMPVLRHAALWPAPPAC